MYRHRPPGLQDPFLVRVEDGNNDDDEEEVIMEMEDTEVVKEVASRSILHWNYRNLTHLPQELLGEFWSTCCPSSSADSHRPWGSHPGDLPERKPD